MSYNVQIFNIQTMRNFENLHTDDFFEHSENLSELTEQQFEELKDRLIGYDYELLVTKKDYLEFRKVDFSVQAILTKFGLYFSAASNVDDIFEISMTASEFTDTGEFAKFDPQQGEWEI